MIITEFYREREDGINLYRTYSDQGLMIEQETGAIYDAAIDIENSGHTYTETDQPIPTQEIDEDEAKEAVRVLLNI